MHQKIIAILALLTLIACEQKPASPDNTAAAQPVEEVAAATTAAPAQATPEAAPETQAAADSSILGLGKTPEDQPPGTTLLYGGNFTLSEQPISLASALDKASENEGPYKISAKIKKVCQKKGCWMTLHGDDVKMPIRVKMKDYAFFVPKNAEDLPTVVEGTLKQVTVPQAVAQHYADDEAEATGKPAQKVTQDQESFEFTAVAIQIERPGA